MSTNLQHQAAGEATPFAFIWRQLFQSIPSTPSTIDLSGQVALITGANIGLGFECARQLLALNLSHVILAVRSKSRGDAAAKRLQAEFPSAKIKISIVDMLSYESIMAFARRCETLPRSDIAVLNAGLSQPNYKHAEETDHEVTFQINYLSTALLAPLLVPILRAKHGTTTPARLCLIGSDTSYYANWKGIKSESIVDVMDNPIHFDSWLSKRVSSEEVIINMFNPGACRGTQFGAVERSMMQEAVLYIPFLLLGRTATVGARQYVDAVAVQDPESHGSFVSEGKTKPFPPIMYEQLGARLREALWEETMSKLAFADSKILKYR